MYPKKEKYKFFWCIQWFEFSFRNISLEYAVWRKILIAETFVEISWKAVKYWDID